MAEKDYKKITALLPLANSRENTDYIEVYNPTGDTKKKMLLSTLLGNIGGSSSSFTPLRTETHLENLISNANDAAENAIAAEAPVAPVFAELLESIPISSAALPAHVFIFPRNGGKFTAKSDNAELIFEGAGIVADTHGQLFSGFAPGKVKFTGTYPDHFRLEWFGAKADNATDCWDAWEAMQRSMMYSNVSYGVGNYGGRVQLPIGGGVYYMSKTMNVFRPLTFIGGAMDVNRESNVYFRFPPNTTGMRILSLGAINYGHAAGADLGGFGLIGDVSSTTNTIVSVKARDDGRSKVTLTGGAITKVAGNTPFDHPDTSERGMVAGNTITIENAHYVTTDFDSMTMVEDGVAVPRGKNVIFIEDVRFIVGKTGAKELGLIDGTKRAQKMPATNHWGGRTIEVYHPRFEKFTTTIVSHDFTGGGDRFRLQDNLPAYPIYGTSGGGADEQIYIVIRGVNDLTAKPARLNIYNGIEVGSQVKLSGIGIRDFCGMGCVFWSSRATSIPLNQGGNHNAWNTNLCQVRRVFSFYNEGSGFGVRGIDSNAMELTLLEASYNRAAGLYEEGSYGSNYYAFHSAYNTFGALVVNDSTTTSCFTATYTEAGQPPVRLAPFVDYNGGISGAGIDPEYGSPSGTGTWKGRFTANGGFYYQRPHGSRYSKQTTRAVSIGLGDPESPNQLMGVGAAEDEQNIGNSGTALKNNLFTHTLVYDKIKRGWFGWHNTYTGFLATLENAWMAFSGSNAAEGAGQLWLPRGFFAGKDTARRRVHYVEGGAPSGLVVELGDQIWNKEPGIGVTQPIGWIVAAGGTVGSGAVLIPISYGVEDVPPPYVPEGGMNFGSVAGVSGIYIADNGVTGVATSRTASYTNLGSITDPPPTVTLRHVVYTDNPASPITRTLEGFTPNAKYRFRLFSTWDNAAYSFTVSANGAGKGTFSIPAGSQDIVRVFEFQATADTLGKVAFEFDMVTAQALVSCIDWMEA